MADSPEYRTLIQLRSELVFALVDDLVLLSDELLAKGVISDENVDTLKNPSSNASNRVFLLSEYILNRVRLDVRNYQVFIDVLKLRSDDHKDILRILDEKLLYERLSKFLLNC